MILHVSTPSFEPGLGFRLVLVTHSSEIRLSWLGFFIGRGCRVYIGPPELDTQFS